MPTNAACGNVAIFCSSAAVLHCSKNLLAQKAIHKPQSKGQLTSSAKTLATENECHGNLLTGVQDPTLFPSIHREISRYFLLSPRPPGSQSAASAPQAHERAASTRVFPRCGITKHYWNLPSSTSFASAPCIRTLHLAPAVPERPLLLAEAENALSTHAEVPRGQAKEGCKPKLKPKLIRKSLYCSQEEHTCRIHPGSMVSWRKQPRPFLMGRGHHTRPVGPRSVDGERCRVPLHKPSCHFAA